MARFKTVRIIGFVLKTLFTLLIAGICGILVWRVFFSTNIPDSVNSLLPNATLHSAYESNGEALTLRYQEQASITRAESNAGYFSVVSCVFIPEANQVQLIFRYNNSTVQHLAEDYGLEQVPSKSEHLFDVSLVRTTDLTPSDRSDNLDSSTLSQQRIFPTQSVRDETLLYTYYRYVFDGVQVEEVTDGIYVDIYYVGDADYTLPAYGTLCIYSYDEDWLTYKPSAADRRAMRQTG